MSFSTSPCSEPSRFRLILQSFLQRPGLPFADVLPEAGIQAAFAEEKLSFAEDEEDVYTPAVTLWAFLSQMLFKDEQRSCLAAVARVVVLYAALGREVSGNSGAYCRARAKLSETVLGRLTRQAAVEAERAVPETWLWHGRHVRLVDGLTVSMPDTEANQKEYPQHGVQKKGLGFPIARMVVCLSLATGLLQDMAIGKYMGKATGETALLRALLDRFAKDDIFLADRYYCSYFMLCLLRECGLDFAVRLHQQRDADFRRGRRLGYGDHVVTWQRPVRPDWMDEATYARMPATLTIREVDVQIEQPGFRTRSLVVVTSLCDEKQYTREDLAELYHQRWLAELDIRVLKTTLGMDVLRCQTPEMVRKEIWTCLLAYNLIRRTLLQAADQGEKSPRQLSFTAALQKIAASWTTVLLLSESSAQLLIAAHLSDLALHVVGNRPNRVEPRAIKRRPKPHALLTKPRAEARAELIAGKA